MLNGDLAWLFFGGLGEGRWVGWVDRVNLVSLIKFDEGWCYRGGA